MTARPIRSTAPATTLDGMAVIEVHELHKRYGETIALDGVSFDVQAGEVFGLLGPNGAGKTTAVEIMEGLRTPDSGTVRVLGLDPERSGSQLRERVGVQLQQAQLQEKIRVGEALELYAGFYRNPRPVDELLDEWGLAAKRNTAFKKLSGGQQQRVFLALALLGRPELVFFDEITTGLDPAARRQTWDLVRRVRDSGVTVVLVSHLMDEVEELCDRLAIVRSGSVIYEGRLDELLHSTGQRYRLRTTDDERALEVAAHQPGVGDVRRDGDGLSVAADEDAAAGLSIALVDAGLGIRALVPAAASLEELFFRLTEGDANGAAPSQERVPA